MKILIREGSSARNFEALWPLIDEFPDQVMLCTDDFHPDDLLNGHIDRLIRMGLEKGVDFFNLYRAASLNPIAHYGLGTGTLQPGDPADFIITDPVHFRVDSTWVAGHEVFRQGAPEQEFPAVIPLNVFHASTLTQEQLEVKGTAGVYRVIGASDGELLTEALALPLDSVNGVVTGDVKRDILKLVVVNRYVQAPPAMAWITGFGLREGAIASSIAHDSHNIIAVGTSDKELTDAINAVIASSGGIAVNGPAGISVLPLPVAGLMSTQPAGEVGEKYAILSRMATGLGSPMKAPFMTLSFMALLVIPHLKLSDLGLFDGDAFRLTTLKPD